MVEAHKSRKNYQINSKSTSDRQSNCKSTSERQSNLLFVCCSILGKKYFYFILPLLYCMQLMLASVSLEKRV